MYPNNFMIKNWRPPFDILDPDGTPPLPYSKYQNGRAGRGLSSMIFPLPAAFAAVAPFNFLTIIDNQGHSKTFEFRPDVVGPPTPTGQVTSVPNRKMVPISGLGTATLVAAAFQNAVAQVSILQKVSSSPTLNGGGMLGVWPQTVSPKVDLILTSPGPGGRVDFTGMIVPLVVGFLATNGFFGGFGQIMSGKVPATGWILNLPAASYVAGEVVNIQGRALTALTNPTGVNFEFRPAGGAPAAGNVAVDLTGLVTDAQVATALANAINNVGNPPVGPNSPGLLDWRVTARIMAGAPSIVLLTYDFAGSVGGSLLSASFITETVVNPLFLVSGMSGGQDLSIMAPVRWGLSRGFVPGAGGVGAENNTPE